MLELACANERVRRLVEIGISLSAQCNLTVLLEQILFQAKALTAADGGTLYTVKQGALHFEILSSDSLNIHVGGTSGKEATFAQIPLFIEGRRNEQAVVTCAAHRKASVNVEDAYTEKGFDFSAPRRFDEGMGYRTKSVLAVPILSYEQEVIAVLQLINARDRKTKEIVSFVQEDIELIEALGSEAGVAIANRRLMDELKELFNAFISVIAETIDAKSPSTANHGRRVPILCEMLAHAVNDVTTGPLAAIDFTPEEIEELKVAAFLHDCGKITTPVNIMEKHTKLEAITDRMELVSLRFELLRQKARTAALQKKLAWYQQQAPHLDPTEDFVSIAKECDALIASYDTDEKFVERCNKGEEKMQDTMYQRLASILTSDELKNISIPYGNLTDEERKIIENHVVLTENMLSRLPFPKGLRRVPCIAASHHERVDGKGYPHGLKKDELLLQSRILAIADIFEALSAPDRPYKKPLLLSQIHEIMQRKVDEGHLDKDLYDIFISQKVPEHYALAHLAPEQMH